jgi:predicted RNase H-like HicB family nuclease
MSLPVHQAVLDAANRVAASGDGTFTPEEIVRALPHLNENTIRTHIVSRCCVGAPQHHDTVWPYFRRVSRGRYEIESRYRIKPAKATQQIGGKALPIPSVSPDSGIRRSQARDFLRDTIHSIIRKGESFFIAECLEIAVVTQGKTLDEVVANVHQAIALHLEDEDLALLGLVDRPRIQFIYDMALAS